MTGSREYTCILFCANWEAPKFANATARRPPMTPSGVSAASMIGNRSSASAKNALLPMNSRYW